MKKVKRYKTGSTIEHEIDRLRELMDNELKEAEFLDKQADQIFGWINTLDVPSLKDEARNNYQAKWHEATDARNRAEMLRRQRPRRELKLRHLKETLAVFNTQPFAFMSDKSVTEQPLRT